MLMLLLVAVMSLILGMGLPTTANYIVGLKPDGAGHRRASAPRAASSCR